MESVSGNSQTRDCTHISIQDKLQALGHVPFTRRDDNYYNQLRHLEKKAITEKACNEGSRNNSAPLPLNGETSLKGKTSTKKRLFSNMSKKESETDGDNSHVSAISPMRRETGGKNRTYLSTVDNDDHGVEGSRRDHLESFPDFGKSCSVSSDLHIAC